MPKTRDAIYVGIGGKVLALDRTNGVELWRADLKGTDFVNVTFDGDRVVAATRGELYCLDSVSGQIVWTNGLKGLGRGLVTVATANSPTGPTALAAEKKRRDEETTAVTGAG